MKHKGIAGLAALAFAFAALAPAQIRRLSLDDMVEYANDAIHGTITDVEVFRVDDPIDGPELYFTNLTIEGKRLSDGTPSTLQVTFAGGFMRDENGLETTEGVYNSEAPSKDDTKLGNTIVAFYAWQDNMGGGVSGNALVAAHGGLYRTLSGPTATAVLGRGFGYAIDRNVSIETLEGNLQRLYRAKR